MALSLQEYSKNLKSVNPGLSDSFIQSSYNSLYGTQAPPTPQAPAPSYVAPVAPSDQARAEALLKLNPSLTTAQVQQALQAFPASPTPAPTTTASSYFTTDPSGRILYRNPQTGGTASFANKEAALSYLNSPDGAGLNPADIQTIRQYINGGPQQAGDTPSTTGNSQFDDVLATLKSYVSDYLSKGYTINPALNIDQGTIDGFLTQAQKEIHPYYAQQIGAIKDALGRNANQVASEYNTNTENGLQQFQNDLGNAREGYAGNGLAFSGQRGLGEQNMVNKENRTLDYNSLVANNQIGDLARSAEAQVGASNLSGFQLPSVVGRKASLEGARGRYDTESALPGYTPGLYGLGSIPLEENAAAKSYQNQLTNEAYQRASNGMSYADLIK